MTTAVQRRRGTNTEHATFTGLDGEITVNTTTYTLHVHDGATVGGVALAKADGSNLVTSSIDINGGTIDGTVIGGSSAAAGTFTSITGTSANINGTVTADGLTVDAGTSTEINLPHNGFNYIDFSGAGAALIIRRTGDLPATRWSSNGDINLGYEDTGTTAKLFWDASAESLGIGTSSPFEKLSVGGADETSLTNQIAIRASDNDDIFRIRTNNSTEQVSIEASGDAGNGFITFGSGAGSAERMRIDSSGNVGINTTPKAWTAFNPVLQIKNASTGGGGALAGTSADNFRMFANTYYDGAYKRLATGFATQYGQESGAHVWSYAASGAADSTFTWSEAMRIDSSGNVGIGVSSLVTGSTRRVLQVSTGSDGGQLALADSTTEAANPRIFATNKEDLKLSTANTATGTIQFITGSTPTERARLDASGNWLVGTTDTDPSNNGADSTADDGVAITDGEIRFAKYQATANSGAVAYVNRTGSDGDILRIRKSGTTVGSIGTASSYLTIGSPVGSGGHLLIGNNLVHPATSTGASKDASIDIGGSSNRFKDLYLSGDVNLKNNSQITFASTSCNIEGNSSGADFIKFTTANSEAVRIDSSGNLLVGCTATPSGSVKGVMLTRDLDSEANKTSTSATTGVNHFTFFNPNGAVGSISTSASATVYNTLSDQRLKENIVDAPSASDDIDAIQVRSFDWKADGSHQKYGMVAQELMTVAPEAVSGDPDSDEIMGVDYSKLVPMMMKEIQSLRARVAQLEGVN